jgi:hypothetical protein
VAANKAGVVLLAYIPNVEISCSMTSTWWHGIRCSTCGLVDVRTAHRVLRLRTEVEGILLAEPEPLVHTRKFFVGFTCGTSSVEFYNKSTFWQIVALFGRVQIMQLFAKKYSGTLATICPNNTII